MNAPVITSTLRKHSVKILIILALVGGGYYYSQKTKAPAIQTQVKTDTVKRGNIVVSVTGSGQIAAKSQVNLKPVVAGDAIEVKQVAVKNDQEVKKGQLIAVLDTTDAVKTVRDAELALQSAKIKQEQTKISNNNDSSADALARKLQKISVSQQAVKLADAKEKLLDYSVRAPFDGVVTGLSVNAGDSVSRDTTLASVITKEMIAKISLNEVDAARVHTGDTSILTVDALSGQSITGTVSKIDTIGTVTQGVVYYNAEISFSNTPELLRPGMSVSAGITVAEKKGVLIVPNSAIKKTDTGESFVQTQRKGTGRVPQTTVGNTLNLEQKTIETGIGNDTQTEVTSGLSEGESIVTQIISGGTSATAQSGGLLNSLTPRRNTGGTTQGR
ncbi:MAG: efflux RND transporter periplasmic adaptor subunit [Candidatus Moraniibacteriota bacterium]